MNKFDLSKLSNTGKAVVELIALMCCHDELNMLTDTLPASSKRALTTEAAKAIQERLMQLNEDEQIAVLSFRAIVLTDYPKWYRWVERHGRKHPGDKAILELIWRESGGCHAQRMPVAGHPWAQEVVRGISGNITTARAD